MITVYKQINRGMSTDIVLHADTLEEIQEYKKPSLEDWGYSPSYGPTIKLPDGKFEFTRNVYNSCD